MTELPLRVAVRTLGCKVNQVESDRIASELLGGSWVLTSDTEAAVVVLNTCTVTAEADRKARKAVRRAVNAAGSPTVVVTGCLAALDPDGLRGLSERVVVEADKARVAEAVDRAVGREASGGGVAAPPLRPAGARTRAQVKVQDGCDAGCAYCIVPLARGGPRAVPLREILAEVECLLAGGTSEVVLTGINVGRYRDGDADLAALVRAVGATGIRRVRLSSVEPLDLRGRLLGALASTPAVCPHLHVPLQSGSDAVLSAMSRTYGVAAYAAVIAEARDAIPGLALTTDVIAGFPGETDAHHAETLAFVESLRFSRLHVFGYSRRPATLAAEMPQQVAPAVRTARAAELRALGVRLASEHAASRVGGRASVLVERVDGALAEGTSEDYLKVTVPASGTVVGDIVEVELHAADGGRVLGRW